MGNDFASVALLRTVAFFSLPVPEDSFIFVFLVFFLAAHDTGKLEIRHIQLTGGLICLRRRGAPILGFGMNGAIEEAELKLAPT